MVLTGCKDDPTESLPATAGTVGDATTGASGSGGSTSASGSGGVDTTSMGGDAPTSTEPPPADATTETAESSSTGTPLVLPTPCEEVASVYVDEPAHEPNDTPEEATDLCTIDVVGSWHVIAEIGGDDSIDHFVFRSAGDAGVVPLLLDACFEVTLDLELLQFFEGELQPLWSGRSTAPDCEGIPSAVPAGEDYLLIVSIPAGARIPAGTAYGW